MYVHVNITPGASHEKQNKKQKDFGREFMQMPSFGCLSLSRVPPHDHHTVSPQLTPDPLCHKHLAKPASINPGLQPLDEIADTWGRSRHVVSQCALCIRADSGLVPWSLTIQAGRRPRVQIAHQNPASGRSRKGGLG
jgi:hypothetical protein